MPVTAVRSEIDALPTVADIDIAYPAARAQRTHRPWVRHWRNGVFFGIPERHSPQSRPRFERHERCTVFLVASVIRHQHRAARTSMVRHIVTPPQLHSRWHTQIATETVKPRWHIDRAARLRRVKCPLERLRVVFERWRSPELRHIVNHFPPRTRGDTPYQIHIRRTGRTN